MKKTINNNIEINTEDLDVYDYTDAEKITKLKERIFVLKLVLDTEQNELDKLNGK